MKNVLAALAALLPALAGAAPPSMFTYSGFLQDSTGNPVTTAATLTFRLYAASSGGTALYTEAVTVAPGADGYFSAVIGTGTAIPAGEFASPNFMSVQYGVEAEMAPRIALTSVPSAFSAIAVDWNGVANRPDLNCTGNTPFVTGVGPDGQLKCAATPSGGTASCASGQLLKWNGAAWSCAADADTNTTYTGTFPVAVAGSAISLDPTGCSAGYVMKWGGSAWSCQPDANSGGTVTSVGAGNGTVTGGTATAPTVGLRTCTAGQILKWNGTTSLWECSTDATGTGTVTSVATGAGLTGGPITTSGTLAVSFGGNGTATTASRSDHTHPGGSTVKILGTAPLGGSVTIFTTPRANILLTYSSASVFSFQIQKTNADWLVYYFRTTDSTGVSAVKSGVDQSVSGTVLSMDFTGSYPSVLEADVVNAWGTLTNEMFHYRCIRSNGNQASCTQEEFF